jgi:hypothetical protein
MMLCGEMSVRDLHERFLVFSRICGHPLFYPATHDSHKSDARGTR